ncbi:RNA methyltransferase substrate-binding domain-containing protein [Syntrophomonas palmitatica]|uniref:RNA methyltransferase substrate-binding domain-containing protein n=1 Tax=Syntrophomonas palmitatica TaxID=402877 RepID=UPI0006D12841|nr:RNA methyltransferase substrate-binding domain-containing protein [Syntrophomonas palmitatica]
MQEKLSGINSVREALNGSRKVHRIYVLKERQDNRLQEIIALARTRGIKIEEASRQQLEQLAGNDWHQGVVARVEAIPMSAWKILLNEPQKEQNLLLSLSWMVWKIRKIWELSSGPLNVPVFMG